MKRLGKIFFGVLCMILLFVFSGCAPYIEIIDVKPDKTVQFMWESTKTYTDKTPIDEQYVKVKYLVYSYKAENKDEGPPNPNDFPNLKSEGKLKEYPLIEAEKNSKVIKQEIKFEVEKGVKEKDLYFLLGVQAIPFNKKNGSEIIGSKGSSKRSEISWSRDKKCTVKPQMVRVKVTE